MKRTLYITGGIISVILAILGVILPGLPTTPFLLLAVWFFTHSSASLLRMMMSNRRLSGYVTSYHRRGGLTVKSKILSIMFMWTMVTVSIILQIESSLIKYIIIGVALVGTCVMGFIVPTAKND